LPISSAGLAATGELIPNVYRVLNAVGEVSEGWKAVRPDLPADPAGVHELLESEGVHFDENGRADQTQRWTVDDWSPPSLETAASADGPGSPT
jgi:hypothetical protein